MSVAKERQFFSGDECPECHDGHLIVYCTRVVEFVSEPYRQQYLACKECHHKPEKNKVSVPLIYAPRRSKPRKIKVRRRSRHY